MGDDAGDERLHEEEFEAAIESWEELEAHEQEEYWDRMSPEQREELSEEYSSPEPASQEDAYQPGISDEEFTEAYEAWNDLDSDERREYLKQMSQEQQVAMRREYSHERDDDGERLYDADDWHAYTPDEWNELSSAEKSEIWHRGELTVRERRTMEKEDTYTVDDFDLDPEQYEDRHWNNMTPQERVAVIEHPDYEPEDFGYEPRTYIRGDHVPAGALTGAGIGSGVGLTLSHPFLHSGDPEQFATGTGIYAVSTMGGAGVGGMLGMLPKKEVTEYNFVNDIAQEAWEKQQQQQEEEAEAGADEADDDPNTGDTDSVIDRVKDRISEYVERGRESDD